MFRKKNDKEVNYTKLNDLISLSHIILKILLYAVAIFVICILIEQLRVLLFKFVNKGKIVIKGFWNCFLRVSLDKVSDREKWLQMIMYLVKALVLSFT